MATDISPSIISRIENGSYEVSGKIIDKVVNATDVDRSYFLNSNDLSMLGQFLSDDLVTRFREKISKGAQKGAHQTDLNPWKDEAYTNLKTENETLRQQIDRLTTALLNLSGKVNFPNPLYATGRTFEGAQYSGGYKAVA
jgi:transcriptional regulator with XRE-family HTH domain